MPARNLKKKKVIVKKKKQSPTRSTIKKQTPNKLSVSSLRKILPGALTNYFDFIDGKGTDPCSRVPARSSRITSPFTAMYRFTVSTTTDSAAQFLINPHYTPDGAIVRSPTSLDAQYAAVSYATLPDNTPLNPYTYDAGSTMQGVANPLVPTYRTSAAVDTRGNKPGFQRLRGIRVTIVPRGTQLNAGGEIFILHSPYTNNVAGMTSTQIYEHPDTRRYSIASNRPVHYTSGPLRKRHEFVEIKEFANADNTAYPLVTSADVDVFGDGHSAYGASTHYASDGYKGWDFGCVIKSAVVGQTYEIQVQTFFDLLRTTPSAELSSSANGLPIVTPSVVVHANQHYVDLMDTAHASHSMTRMQAMGSTSQNVSIWPHVEAAAKAVLPHLVDAGIGLLAGM